MLKPLNDLLLIEIAPDRWASSKAAEGYESGTVISLGDFPYFGSNSWMFEKSLVNEEVLGPIRDYYGKLIGKRVYWEGYADRGVNIKKDGKEYVLMKGSKLIAWEDNKKERIES